MHCCFIANSDGLCLSVPVWGFKSFNFVPQRKSCRTKVHKGWTKFLKAKPSIKLKYSSSVNLRVCSVRLCETAIAESFSKLNGLKVVCFHCSLLPTLGDSLLPVPSHSVPGFALCPRSSLQIANSPTNQIGKKLLSWNIQQKKITFAPNFGDCMDSSLCNKREPGVSPGLYPQL